MARKNQEPFELDLIGSMFVLVGQNGSGKTNLLEAIRIFCAAVKHGSSCLSSIDAKKLFGTDQEFNIRINGVFDVHYQDTDDIQSFELEVSLSSLAKKCYNYVKVSETPDDEPFLRLDEISSKECVHIYVTVPWKERCRLNWCCDNADCPEKHDNTLFYQSDYGVLYNLFPQVITFSSKSVLKSVLSDLVERDPDLLTHKDEVNTEICRIFPLIQFTFEFSSARPVLLNRTGRSMTRNLEIFKDVASFGEGVLQCFVLIATVCCAKPNSIITIDEPDAHVFPTAQRLLINFFYRKMEALRQSNSFCKMLITTHSPDTMQAVKLKDIRQIFLDPISRRPVEIKSLACVGHLLNVMTDVGASILSHSEFVRWGVHGKLLYLEDHDDYNFFSGIICRIKPELLYLPFIKMRKGGRTQPSQIKQLIREFRQLLPKTTTLHIFVLVDADLRSRSILQTEKDEYDVIEKDLNLNVKIYYHCWAVREWENWLLSNEDLLYEMLFDLQLHDNEPTIIQLRDRIKNQWPTSQPTTTADAITQAPQIPTSKDQFCNWFTKELHGYFKRLLTTELTSSQMEGIEIISRKDSKESARKAGEEFLRNAGVNDEIMKNFGHLLVPTQTSIGFQLQQQETPKEKGPKNSTKKQNDVENCRAEWLLDRQLQESIDLNNVNVRRELTKWIDAKRFFHQLTHGEISTNNKIDLDEYWKRAFSLGTTDEYNLYGRYFNSLNSQEWPKDFEVLVKEFERFVNAE